MFDTDLDAEAKAALKAADEAENKARQVENRLRRIPGARELYDNSIGREYGQPVDVAAIVQNMTLKSLIQRQDPELAALLGFASAAARNEREQREAREMLRKTIQMRTERLREQNAELAYQHQRMINNGLNPLTGRRFGT